jgi:hypothetical protein
MASDQQLSQLCKLGTHHGTPSGHQNAVVAVFTRHQDAEEAVRKLASGSFDMTHYSIVGQGFHSEEKVVGFYNMGDRIKFWGKNGAFWGGLDLHENVKAQVSDGGQAAAKPDEAMSVR